MADAVVSEIRVTSDKAISDIQSIFAELQKGKTAFNDVTAATARYNKEGELAAVTMTRLINTGQKLTQTITQTEQGLVVTSQSLRNVTKEAKAATAAINNMQNVSNIKNKFQPPKAVNELREYNKLLLDAQKIIGTKVSEADLNKLLGNLDANKLKNAGTELGRLQGILLRIRQLSEGSKSRNTILKDIREAFSGNGYRNLSNYQDVLAKLGNIGLNNNKVKDYVREFLNGSRSMSVAATGDIERVRQQLLRLQREYVNTTRTAEALGNRNKAAAALDAKFGTPPRAALDPRGDMRYQAQRERVLDFVQRRNISEQDFSKVANAGAGQRFEGDLRKLQLLLARLGVTFNDVGKAGANAGNSIANGWKRVYDIFTAQVLYRSLTELINLFRNSSKAAADFEVSISLLQTISQDSALGFDDWATSIRKLSDEFRTPIADVAAGAYEALSNQVAKGADAVYFMTEALKFAQTTNSTAAQSVNLLSSALNSFNLSADQTGRVARVLFSTIDLGRSTASELARDFGRPAVTAAQLGITIEELGASIATLTISGLETSEAFTQITNVYKEMIAPTEKMRDLFDELGVSSGQEAIAAFGQLGFFEKLNEAYDGNNEKLFKMTNEIRAYRGALGQLGPNLQRFRDNLDQITNSEDKYVRAQQLVNKSIGSRFLEETNRVRNFVTKDIGQQFVKAFVGVSEAVGGATNLMKGMLSTLTVLIGAWGAYRAAVLAAATTEALATATKGMQALTKATTIATVAMNLFGSTSKKALIASGVVGALGLIATAFLTIGVNALGAESNIEAFGTTAEAAAKSLADANAVALERTRREDEKSITERRQRLLKFTASYRAEANKQFEIQKENARKTSDLLKDSTDVYSNLLSRSISDLENKAKGLQDSITRAREFIKESDVERLKIAQGLEDPNTVDPFTRAYTIRQKLMEQAKESLKQGDFAEAESRFKEIISLYQSLEQYIPSKEVFARPTDIGAQFNEELGYYTRSLKDTLPLQLEINNLINEQIKLTRQFITEKQREGKVIDETLIKNKQAYEEQKTIIDRLVNFSPFDDKGELKYKDTNKATEEFNKLRADAERVLKESSATFRDRFEFSKGIAEQEQKVLDAIRGQKAAIGESLNTNQTKLNLQELSKTITDVGTLQTNVGNRIRANIKALEDLRVTRAKELGEFIGGSNLNINQDLLNNLATGDTAGLRKSLDPYITEFKASIPSEDNFAQVERQFRDAVTAYGKLREYESLQKRIDEMTKFREEIVKLKDPSKAIESQLKQLDANSAEWANKIKNGSTEAKTALESLKSEIAEIDALLRNLNMQVPILDKENAQPRFNVLPPTQPDINPELQSNIEPTSMNQGNNYTINIYEANRMSARDVANEIDILSRRGTIRNGRRNNV